MEKAWSGKLGCFQGSCTMCQRGAVASLNSRQSEVPSWLAWLGKRDLVSTVGCGAESSRIEAHQFHSNAAYERRKLATTALSQQKARPAFALEVSDSATYIVNPRSGSADSKRTHANVQPLNMFYIQ